MRRPTPPARRAARVGPGGRPRYPRPMSREETDGLDEYQRKIRRNAKIARFVGSIVLGIGMLLCGALYLVYLVGT